MKALVIGSGGREHAPRLELAQSPKVQMVFVAPGNAGTAAEPHLRNVPITDLDQLADFALAEKVALTVVGPEAALAAARSTSSAPRACASSGRRRPRRSSRARRRSPRRS
jgi:phosphoribosylamine-glycine ligase